MVDSGIPLGPGLLATWVPLRGPHTKNANAKINTATIATNAPPPTLPSRSLFGMRFSFVSSDCLLLASATSIAHFDGSGSRVGDQCCDSQHQCNARGKSPFESIVQYGMAPRKMAQPKPEGRDRVTASEYDGGQLLRNGESTRVRCGSCLAHN